jgi:hypothetical protein
LKIGLFILMDWLINIEKPKDGCLLWCCHIVW